MMIWKEEASLELVSDGLRNILPCDGFKQDEIILSISSGQQDDVEDGTRRRACVLQHDVLDGVEGERSQDLAQCHFLASSQASQGESISSKLDLPAIAIDYGVLNLV